MKIFAVGMNYAQHIQELDGAAYKPAQPVIFLKPDSSLLKDGKPFFVPDHLGQIDYEAELVVRICRLGKSIPERFAHRYYDAVTVGIDFTARDLQRQARAAGHPWTLCKGFDGAAAIGEFLPLSALSEELRVKSEEFPTGVPKGSGEGMAAANSSKATGRRESGNLFTLHSSLSFHLDLNGQTVQTGHAADMLFSVDQLISYISQFFTLKTGDLLYTGTPVGVGPVAINDHLEGWIGDRKVLDLRCK